MPDPSLTTALLNDYLDRWHRGDRAARDELLVAVGARVERLARAMLRRFPNVGRYADTDDVIQEALLRLCRTLEALTPASARDFWGLTAVHVRRALLDLARHFGRREAAGLLPPEGSNRHADDAPDPTSSSSDLRRWQAFHEAVERLPDDEREVVQLVYYHGWTHARAAEFLEISTKTVQRRWHQALWRVTRLCAAPEESS